MDESSNWMMMMMLMVVVVVVVAAIDPYSTVDDYCSSCKYLVLSRGTCDVGRQT